MTTPAERLREHADALASALTSALDRMNRYIYKQGIDTLKAYYQWQSEQKAALAASGHSLPPVVEPSAGHGSSATAAIDLDRLKAAYEEFEDYFVRNYPGPETIINKPKWHAPKIFQAVISALKLNDALAGNEPASTVPLAALGSPCDAPTPAEMALEHDRAKVAECVTAVQKALRNYDWLITGRGSYEWNDDRWHEEFKRVSENIWEAIDPMVKIAADWSNCPKKWEDVQAARQGQPSPTVPEGETLSYAELDRRYGICRDEIIKLRHELEAAPRQPAAPSGGAALITYELAEKIHQIIERHSTDVVDYELAADDINALLAQESKTGAVTALREDDPIWIPGRARQILPDGRVAVIESEFRSLLDGDQPIYSPEQLRQRTGAVTETK